MSLPQSSSLRGRSLVEPNDFTLEELDSIFELADDIIEDEKSYLDTCKGKVMALLFYEPSTRTRFSFETAMKRLGGEVVGFDNPDFSSVSKGETLADTVRTVACYSDLEVIRHPREGTARLAEKSLSKMDTPVVNAGDGGHEHPTQTLTDLMTIRHEKGTCNGLKIGFCGDLLFGRTIHSLVKTLDRYGDNEFVFISPKELRLPDNVKNQLDPDSYTETDNLDEVIDDLDILYMTRVQRERFFSEEEYLRLKDYFVLDNKKLRNARPDMIVMHPLPRNEEIAEEVDNDHRAKYFDQAKYGMYVRMALILKLLGVLDDQG